jgi:hypothetical protein
MAGRKGYDPAVGKATAALATAGHYGTLEDVATAKAHLKAEILRRDIESALATAPPLTEDQRTRLAALLAPGRVGAA